MQRDKLQDDTSTCLLVDDASLEFAIELFPYVAEYERKLHRAIKLAAYAKPDNFDDLVKSLKKSTLGKLEKQLFCESNGTTVWLKLFGGEDLLSVRDNPDSPFTVVLFGDEDLPSVRENFRQLRKIRNKVVHPHLITERDYDCAREMLRTSIEELNAYIDEKVHSDVSYPKRHAAGAASAAKLIRDNYESIFEPFATIAAAQDLLDRELWEPFSKASESIRSIGKLSESIGSIGIGSIGKLQTPSSVLENLRLPKMISEWRLPSLATLPSWASLARSFPSPLLGESLASSFPSIDTTASSQAALADIDTESTAASSTIGSSALSSLGQMDSSSTDGSDNDLGDVSDDDGKTGSDEK